MNGAHNWCTHTTNYSNAVGIFQISSEGINAKQIEIQKAERDIDQVRESYRSIALHTAALYFGIGRLKYLDPIYQFSLPWFINLFQRVGSLQFFF